MPIQSYKFFSIYSAVHLHFTSSYDMFKYKGKSKTITPTAYDNRRDRQRFSYFAGHLDSDKHALQFCIFNYLFGVDWLYSSYSDANDKYLEKLKFYSTFTQHINDDYNTIKSIRETKDVSFESLFQETRSGSPPPILQLLWRGDISIEFISLCNNTYAFFNEASDSIDPLVREEVRKICKYTPFVLLFRK